MINVYESSRSLPEESPDPALERPSVRRLLSLPARSFEWAKAAQLRTLGRRRVTDELMPQLSSYLVGTVGLILLLAVSAVLTAQRPLLLNPEIGGRSRFSLIAVLSILAQAAHFVEELLTRFFVRFPEALGLQPWSETFFVSFNVTWIGLWILALAGVRAGYRIAALPLWFLGLAMVLNALAHPALALLVGGYFPGLLTAPLAGALGLLLLRELAKVTTPTAGG